MPPAGRRPSLTSSARGVRAAVLALVVLGLSGCESGLAEPVTHEGHRVETLYEIVYYIALLIFVGIIGAIAYAAVKFRKRPGDDELPPQVHGNTIAEIIWTVIPLLIVLVLFAMSYSTLRVIDDAKPVKDLAAVINVRGVQWGWEFDYGNDKVVTGSSSDKEPPTMVVPVGEDVRLVLTSNNVIHAFFVPHFLFKRDVVPGRQNQMDIRVDIPGTYKGQCAEFCGTDHAKMTFQVKAVPRKAFDAFIEGLTGDLCQGDESQPAPVVKLDSPANQIRFVDPATGDQERCIKVPAGAPVKVEYSNGGGQQHNFAVVTGTPANPEKTHLGLPQAKLLASGSTTYDVPALPAGNYTFFCQVHPIMNGTYLVQ